MQLLDEITFSINICGLLQASYLADKETSDKEGGDKTYVVSGEEPTNSRRYSQMSIGQ